jgi:hypothetical protein
VPDAKSSAWVSFPPFVSIFTHGPLLSLSLVSTPQSEFTEAELDTVQKKKICQNSAVFQPLLSELSNMLRRGTSDIAFEPSNTGAAARTNVWSVKSLKMVLEMSA